MYLPTASGDDMLTLFSTAKPFRGHIGIIQRNALKSWTTLHPDVEIILFGDDEGAAEIARDLGIRHEPCVERNASGSKRIDYIFGMAQARARHSVLCYVNCDIILMGDFIRAVECVRRTYSRFLMVGRRWDAPLAHSIDFSDLNWSEKVRALALSANDPRDEWWIDYFVFSRGSYENDLPPLVIGTVRWDNWLIWKALHTHLPVVDASKAVFAIHQNHDYSYHPQGKQGVWEGEEAKKNLQLAGGSSHLRSISHSTCRLTADGRLETTQLQRTWFEMKRFIANPVSKLWHSGLRISYSARHAVGLNRQGITRLRSRFRLGRNSVRPPM